MRVAGPSPNSNGDVFAADRPYGSGPYGYLGSSSTRSTNAPIAGTEDDGLYQDRRIGMTNYRFAVPDGTYRVDLLFAEIDNVKAGGRMFDVSIEGDARPAQPRRLRRRRRQEHRPGSIVRRERRRRAAGHRLRRPARRQADHQRDPRDGPAGGRARDVGLGRPGGSTPQARAGGALRARRLFLSRVESAAGRTRTMPTMP